MTNMMENLLEHNKNEYDVLGGWLKGFFLVSHFLRPKKYF
jgi:hypothetical protein